MWERKFPYPPEFRAEAIRLSRQPGTTLTGVANDLGIAMETLRKWVRQAEIDEGRRDGLTTEEGGAPEAPPQGPGARRGTGDPEKSRGLLRQGERDPVRP